jgi:Ni/Co efflux regulator RcnB
MRLTKVLLTTVVAGLFATPVFAQATPPKTAAKTAVMKDQQTESKAQKKADKAAANAEHKAFDKATSAHKKWLSGVKLTATEKTQAKAIETKYSTQLATMKKDHLAAEKAGTETDVGLAAKVQAVADQEKAELRAVLTADQQTKFDANAAPKPAKK